MTILLIALLAFAATTIGILKVLGLPRLASARARMARTPMKCLALLIPFSPAVTMALGVGSGALTRVQQTTGVPIVFGVWCLIGTSVVVAALAGCWLSLPRREDQPLRVGPALFLGVILWWADNFVAASIAWSAIRGK